MKVLKKGRAHTMVIQYYKERSEYLKREMEFKVYGHGGPVCLAFSCEGGRFYDWEDRGLVNALGFLIDAGRLRLVCADSIDAESWLSDGEGRRRAENQERWFCWLTRELVPRARELCALLADEKLLAAGISLGAGHAANLYLRRPDLFGGAVCLSGSYTARGWFGGYADDLTLRNSPTDYLRLIPAAQLAQYTGPFLLCCGQGPYEDRFLAETRAFDAALAARGLPVRTDLWGADVSHDWPWWQKELAVLFSRMLDAPDGAPRT